MKKKFNTESHTKNSFSKTKKNLNSNSNKERNPKSKSFVKVNIIGCTSNKVIYKFETSKDMEKFFLKNEMTIECIENNTFDLTTVPESILIIPAISNILPVIWLLDSTLIINELDDEFYKSIPNIKQGYVDMYKKANFKGQIKCKTLKNNKYECQNKYLSFFSGGVDSVSMAVEYMEYKPTLITLWGSDIPLSEEEGWETLKDKVNQFAEDYDLNAFYLKSDFRLLLDTRKLYAHLMKNWKMMEVGGMQFSMEFQLLVMEQF